MRPVLRAPDTDVPPVDTLVDPVFNPPIDPVFNPPVNPPTVFNNPEVDEFNPNIEFRPNVGNMLPKF